MREALRRVIEGEEGNVVVRRQGKGKRNRKRGRQSGTPSEPTPKSSFSGNVRPNVGRREYKPTRKAVGDSDAGRPRRPARPGTAGPRSSRTFGRRTTSSETRKEAGKQNSVRRTRPSTARARPRMRYQPGSLFQPVRSAGADATAPMCRSSARTHAHVRERTLRTQLTFSVLIMALQRGAR